jgi:uncharacterized protein (DUF305 family)
MSPRGSSAETPAPASDRMTDRKRRTLALVTGVIVVGFIALVALSVGGRDAARPDPSDTDGAFIAGMVPHHESAVAMAELALDRGEHPQVRRLARDIMTSQTEEIGRLEGIHQRIFGASLSSMSGQHGNMGGMASGMAMSPRELGRAAAFDRAFIDAMVPHHEDAIRMARTQLSSGRDPELKRIARAIIDAQSREIAEMRRWRTRWYPST